MAERGKDKWLLIAPRASRRAMEMWPVNSTVPDLNTFSIRGSKRKNCSNGGGRAGDEEKDVNYTLFCSYEGNIVVHFCFSNCSA